jgi:putative ABC transport system permease protein
MALWHDVQYGSRILRKNLSFTLSAVLTLALGIGGATAIFSVVNGILLRPLPYRSPERLVQIWENHPDLGQKIPVAPANFQDWQRQSRSFQALTAYIGPEAGSNSIYTVNGTGEPERIQGTSVAANVFAVVGVVPMLGRSFAAGEVGPDRDGVVVISHAYWRSHYAENAKVLGSKLAVDGKLREIVGVMPAGFSFPTASVQLWVPFNRDFSSRRRAHMFQVIGRLAPGASEAQARSELETIAGRLAKQYPDSNAGVTVGLMPLREWVVGDTRPMLVILLSAVGFVLLIACANVTNLLLSRAAHRGHELAVRAALGAGRSRLVRQLLTESLLLALCGGAGGLLIAIWCVDLLGKRTALPIPRLAEVSIDSRILAFALSLVVVTALLCGLAPSLQNSRVDLHEPLKEGGRQGGGGRRSLRTRSLLVAAQIALSLVLVTGTALMVKSFSLLQQVDPGFQEQRVLTFGLSLPRTTYRENPQVSAFFQRLLERLRGLPGVEAVGATSVLPLQGLGWSGDFTIEGQAPATAGEGPKVRHQEVTPGFFSALGVPVRAGRAFRDSDDATAPLVILVNQTFVRQYLAGRNPEGARIKFATATQDAPFATVVGVVGDLKQDGLDAQVAPEIYQCTLQKPQRSLYLAVRTRHPEQLIPAVRQVTRELDANLALSEIQTGEGLIARSLARPRFLLFLLFGFAIVALAMAAIGTYGLMSYSVAQQTRDIGIRIALGADSGQVRGEVLKRGMGLVLAGLAAGLAVSLLLIPRLAGSLFGVSATDPLVFGAVLSLLLGVAFLACYLPARRATRVDPLVALRYQ